ncbi:MAG: phosphoribosylformylglycinamidine synthase [Bacilli bacterium]|jgi:phosphoribosylformylglycinamidine synthase|nr:phosphoribosylformylglycinamidine synthase [Bacilli bacterium]
MNQRLYVEKKSLFQTTANSILKELNDNLKLDNLTSLRMIQVYDVINVKPEILTKAKKTLFMEIATDKIMDNFYYGNYNYFCIEALPGQFDQRASSARSGLMLLGATSNVEVKSSIIYIINDDINYKDKRRIIDYLINPLENQLKDLSLPIDRGIDIKIKDIEKVTDFITLNKEELLKVLEDNNLAMNIDDLEYIKNYFQSIKRNPTITELLVLDTYWSDHCRHTTFETKLDDIIIENKRIKEEIEEALSTYYKLRHHTKRTNKPMSLMDMASIEAKYEKAYGMLDDMEISDEVNACSIEVDVDVDGVNEKYLVMYKNETHNHPTEIEPFGGASTCLGGAIRDPLSGRAYVYQAMRISGAANILEDIEKTIAGKLPQKNITQKAAAGYSSYGNQIGLTGAFINEIYHEGYQAKRMELGAVVGAVKKSDIIRLKPEPGDIVLLLGAPTGRDGIGGATGSSKVQKANTLQEAKSEVQKGNAPEERKLQRLFRNPQVTKLIKKANDFGAGGVSVAIGELADGIDINLDVIPTKYAGLNGTDLALSESQERMAVVIKASDFDLFKELAYQENLEAIKVATITQIKKLIMRWENEVIVDLDRDFLDTNGLQQQITPIIKENNEKSIFTSSQHLVNNSFKESLEAMVTKLNYAQKKSLQTIFDSTVGKTTVLGAYGGKYQASMAEVSAQKIPLIKGHTNTVSLLGCGGNPAIGCYEPFYVGSYAIIEAVARLVATGCDYQKIRLSLQEYFEKVTNNPAAFGKPVAALLGALHTMHQLRLPALGGKDSMSGNYHDLKVPPTVMAFGLAIEDVNNIISPEFKESNHYVYALLTNKNEKIDYDLLKNNFNYIKELNNKKLINSCISIKDGGIAHALAVASYGNNIGVALNDIDLDTLFYPSYGSFVFSTSQPINNDNLILLGQTINNQITYQDEIIDIKELLTISEKVLAPIFSTTFTHQDNINNNKFDFEMLKNIEKKESIKVQYSLPRVENPLVYIPVFYGTNCEYDVQKAFQEAGAITKMIPFIDIDEDAITKSIDLMVKTLDEAHILALSGGFSAGDEPDGSGKYIVNILLNDKVKAAINRFIAREGLIIGICNGFQALIKSGLLPYGKIGELNKNMPTLFLNERGKHVADFVKTKIINNNSPWLSKLECNKQYTLAISHGEGRFIASSEVLIDLFKNNQVISQYVDFDNEPNMDYRFNPNGSWACIEGITSPDGRILGKMGHSERYEEGCYLNICGDKNLDIFASAVAYFRKEEN